MCPQKLTTHEALQMTVGGMGEHALAMLDVVDLNGDVRRSQASDEEKNIMFLSGLEKIVKERTEKLFGQYYVHIKELMDELGRRPGTVRQVKLGHNKLAIYLGVEGDDELAYYDHSDSIVAKFRIDPEGTYLLSPGVDIKEVVKCLKLTEEFILGCIRINTSPK